MHDPKEEEIIEPNINHPLLVHRILSVLDSTCISPSPMQRNTKQCKAATKNDKAEKTETTLSLHPKTFIANPPILAHSHPSSSFVAFYPTQAASNYASLDHCTAHYRYVHAYTYVRKQP